MIKRSCQSIRCTTRGGRIRECFRFFFSCRIIEEGLLAGFEGAFEREEEAVCNFFGRRGEEIGKAGICHTISPSPC